MHVYAVYWLYRIGYVKIILDSNNLKENAYILFYIGTLTYACLS